MGDEHLPTVQQYVRHPQRHAALIEVMISLEDAVALLTRVLDITPEDREHQRPETPKPLSIDHALVHVLDLATVSGQWAVGRGACEACEVCEACEACEACEVCEVCEACEV